MPCGPYTRTTAGRASTATSTLWMALRRPCQRCASWQRLMLRAALLSTRKLERPSALRCACNSQEINLLHGLLIMRSLLMLAAVQDEILGKYAGPHEVRTLAGATSVKLQSACGAWLELTMLHTHGVHACFTQASQMGDCEAVQIWIQRDPSCVNRLLPAPEHPRGDEEASDQEGDPLPEPDGDTLLHIAVESGNAKLVELLVKNGALLDAKNKVRASPRD
jgi:hypothetical protein